MIGSHFELKALFDVFRQALCAMVPVVEQVEIPWMEGDAYDDWDEIASTLYEQLVLNTVRSSSDVPDDLSLPKYDLIQPSYDDKAHFEVVLRSENKTLGPFVGFLATDRHFRNVKYAVRDSGGTVDTTTTGERSFEVCSIRLRLPQNDNRNLERLTASE